MRKGMKRITAQNKRYIQENRHTKNKIARMRKTLKRQPNNEELRTRLKKIA
jgi:5-bromo-4-chloroindolyl phosphate hydrolysis protein